jgi:hypothetical protein
MEFALKYEGVAVERARMSARDLGPALFSAAVLLERTSELLYGEHGKVRVDVEADFKAGSFLIDFSILAESANHHLSHLTTDDLRLILQVLGITGGGGGLVALLRWLRGRKPDRIEQATNGSITVFVQDNSVTLNANESKVFLDRDVRSSLDGVIEPVRRAGIDAVSFGPGRELTTRISKEEAEYFQPREEAVIEVSVDEITTVVEIVSPAFRQNNKWRFVHAGATFYAPIYDERFLARVARSEEKFGAGDALKVRALLRSIRAPEGLRHEWEILEVLDHLSGGGEQLGLMEE